MRKQFSVGKPWSPNLPLMHASGSWDALSGSTSRSSRPRVAMVILLLLMCVAGVYLSAVVSSKQSKPSGSTGRLKSGISMFGPKRTAQASDDGIESKGLLSSSWWAHSDDPVEEEKPAVQTLVLYIFSNTDPEYIDNLRYYVRTAIQEDDGCQHVIVVNSGEDSPVVDLPDLPANAKYLQHANECYDWGTFGWALEHEQVQVRDYKYFIFLNSSVRGPFIPPYLQGKMHFSELMTGMLNLDDAANSIKMVGPSINCEGTVKLPGGLQRSNPHVQSFAVATDQTGMQLLIDDGKVFGCYDNIDETIYHSELGSSDAILRAGYNIASFMSRYQGVNWLDENNWNCNDGENPFNWGAVDIFSLQPMELMFVKVKHWALTNGYPSMVEAVQYDEWSAAAATGQQEVSRHKLKEAEWDHKAGRILKYAAKGPQCWDCEFYKRENEDLGNMPCHDAYAHFVNAGQFEPTRPFRYNCDTDWETHGVPFNPDSYGGVRGWPLISADSCQPDPALALVVDASTTAADTTSQSETVGVVEIDSSGSESTDSSTVQPEASILDAQTQSTA